MVKLVIIKVTRTRMLTRMVIMEEDVEIVKVYEDKDEIIGMMMAIANLQ